MMAAEDSQSGMTVEKDKITPELVRQVAEKVYALWLQDLKVARERKRRRRQGRA